MDREARRAAKAHMVAHMQAATAMFGDSLVVALIIGLVGVVLLIPGGWMLLHESRV